MVGLGLAVSCGGGDTDARDVMAGSSTETATVAASGSNQAPVARSVRFDPTEPAQGALIRAVVSASDPDGDRVTLRYDWTINGDPVPGNSREITLTKASKGSVIAVAVTPSDGITAGKTLHASVTVINRPPIVTGVGVEPVSTVAPGNPITAIAQARDPDGDSVDFEWEWQVNGEPVDTRGNLFSTEGLKQGDIVRVEVVASDGTNRSASARSAEVTVGSAHPEITSQPPGIDPSGVFRYAVKAVDPDGDRRLRYSLESAPEGMGIDEIFGEILWKPTAKQTGLHAVAVVVTDSAGLQTTQKFEITVSMVDAAPASPDAN
jgi:hypothetical protein